MAILEIKGLTKYFGGLAAVSELDMNVDKGEIVGLIGPNGAGKTTAFNLISGFLKPTKGQIVFEQSDITGKPAHSIAEKGIARTFQETALLPHFSVLENVWVSCHLHPKVGLWQNIFNTSKYRQKEKNSFNRAREIVQFVGLDIMKDELVQNLPYGYKRTLGIAVALSANPKLLLLDEPLGGMNASEVSRTIALISKIRSGGITVLLVEHNMTAVMQLCDRIVVLNFGHKIAEGLPDEIRRNGSVIEAYLGVAEHAA